MPQPARGLYLVLEIVMPVSDILLECSRECARLSRDCQDEKIALTLFEISTRLLAAAARDAELVIGDACNTPQPDLSFGFVDKD